jgi:porin
MQHHDASFIFEPMGYALGNLFTNYESYDPPSTPAMEVRVVQINHLYVKSMVEAEDRNPYVHSPTRFVPQYRRMPVSISDVEFTSGKASSVGVFDNVESRKGYLGLISLVLLTIPANSQHQPAQLHVRATTSSTGWRAGLSTCRPSERKRIGRDVRLRLESSIRQSQQ